MRASASCFPGYSPDGTSRFYTREVPLSYHRSEPAFGASLKGAAGMPSAKWLQGYGAQPREAPLRTPISRQPSPFLSRSSRPASALPHFAPAALQEGGVALAPTALLTPRPTTRSQPFRPARLASLEHPDMFKIYADQSVRLRAQLRDEPISGCPRPALQKSSKFAGVA